MAVRRARIGGTEGRRRRVRPTRIEAFADASKLSSVSGLTFDVARPVNNPSNPVYAGTDMSYDRHAVYVGAVKVGTRLHMWLGVWDDNWGLATTGIGTTYVYSDDDGDTFTEPNLGLVSYGGNTNNNILAGTGPLNASPNAAVGAQNAVYAPDNPVPYLIPVTHNTTNSASITRRIYGSATPGGALSLVQDMGAWNATLSNVASGTNVVRDVMSLVQRADGRWLALYQEYTGTERRSVGVLLSNETTITSGTTWVNHGVPSGLLATQPYDQNYYAYAWRDGEVLFMAVLKFSGGSSGSLSDYYYVYDYGTFSGHNDRQWKFELWTSRADDGLAWTRLDADWYWAGSGVNDNTPGEWNAGAIKPGAMVRLDDVDRFFSCGSSEVHHPLNGRDNFVDQHRVGYADLRREGICQLTGTGSARLDEVRGSTSGVLTINSTGTVKVELLNPKTGAVLHGFSQSDCDTIPSDALGVTVSWGGRTATPARFIAKVYGTSADVNRVVIA